MSPNTYAHDIEVQYRDLDPRKHVNHAVFVSYLEQAKGAFFRDELGTPLSDARTAIRSLDVDYLAPIEPGDVVTVALGAMSVGETSFTIEYEMRVDGTVAATAETVSVLLDEEGNSRPLPDEWRRGMEPYTEE